MMRIVIERCFACFFLQRYGSEEMRLVYEVIWAVGVFVESLAKQIDERECSDITGCYTGFLKLLGDERITEESLLLNELSEAQIK